MSNCVDDNELKFRPCRPDRSISRSPEVVIATAIERHRSIGSWCSWFFFYLVAILVSQRNNMSQLTRAIYLYMYSYIKNVYARCPRSAIPSADAHPSEPRSSGRVHYATRCGIQVHQRNEMARLDGLCVSSLHPIVHWSWLVTGWAGVNDILVYTTLFKPRRVHKKLKYLWTQLKTK